MTSGTVPGILDLEAALYDLGLESLCSKNLLPPLLGTQFQAIWPIWLQLYH